MPGGLSTQPAPRVTAAIVALAWAVRQNPGDLHLARCLATSVLSVAGEKEQ